MGLGELDGGTERDAMALRVQASGGWMRIVGDGGVQEGLDMAA